MKDRRNYYRILHVQPDAPREIIRSSYRTLMQRMSMHPDLGGDDSKAAVINEAYSILTDPQDRSAYDQSRGKLDWSRASGKTIEETLPAPPNSQQQCSFCSYPSGDDRENPLPAFCGHCQSPLGLVESSQLENRDRRTSMRVQNEHPLMFYTHWPQSEPHSGRVDDISLSGVKFTAATGLALGQIIKIDTRVLKAVARLTRRKQQRHAWEFGAQFISLCFTRSRGSFIRDRV